jgi:hypothetical protein
MSLSSAVYVGGKLLVCGGEQGQRTTTTGIKSFNMSRSGEKE